MRIVGLSPDFIVCRCEVPVEEDIREKIAMFTNVKKENVFSAHNVPDIFHVPKVLNDQQIGLRVLETLNLELQEPKLVKWNFLLDTLHSINEDESNSVTIAIIGKYTGLLDSYLSISKALEHGAIHANRKMKLNWIESSDLLNKEGDNLEKYEAAWEKIRASDGLLVPGGFGSRGALGKLEAIKYARENKKPFLGICLGMQMAVIEFCRNVCGIKYAETEEYDPEGKENVIVFMPEISKTIKGGTMRLGGRHTYIKDPNSLAAKIYYGKN